jgi:hypothetical protein
MGEKAFNQCGRYEDGLRHHYWGLLAADPVVTVAMEVGDAYFNTTHQILMTLDIDRTRWVPAGKFLPTRCVRSDNGYDAPPVRQVVGAGGAIAWIANARGGVKRFTSIAQAAPTSEDNNAIYWISLQDDPELNARFAVQQFNVGVPDAYMIVGWYSIVGADAVWLVADAAASANWRMRVTRAGATTDHATAVPVVIGQYIRTKFKMLANGDLQCYINDVLAVTVPAANLPAQATMMEEWRFTRPVIPAILAELDIDYCETTLGRNMAVTP